jgi:ATP-dependent DNA ligase
MSLPLRPPLEPELALTRKELPEGEDYVYEVKLDGFRCVAFVDGEEAFLQSRNGRPLSRYFPELVLPAGSYVLDGEIVIRDGSGRENFDALQQRIHPAASRIELLSRDTPARYIVFDLLARDGESLLERPFSERRSALEGLVGEREFADAPVDLMEATQDPARAREWLQGAEGTVAKLRSAPYVPGKRAGMFKVKRVRTIDAVLVGWRPGKEKGTVGALILGLYDGPELRVVGHCSGLSAEEKRRLVGFLKPYETGERGSGDASRWTAGRDLEWVALRPDLVLEIDFDHVSAGRIRHGAKLRRWREDKPPQACTIDQLAA